MRRRLVVAMVGVVVGALLIAGTGTLLLARRASREQTRRDLVREAQAIAQVAEESQRPAVRTVIQRVLKLEGFELVPFGPAGRATVAPPAGLAPADLQPADLLAGATVSGTRGTLVYAAAPVVRPRGVLAVVVTRRLAADRRGAGYFLLAAGLALAAAVAVAEYLARRIVKPLADAEAATRSIASGSLTVQVPVPDGSYPELASLARSINTMAESLSRAKGLERQFLLSVSHDLRTPLTSIQGFAEAIADGAATDTHRAAEVIAAEARRLERLVRDLLDLAKLDARRFSLDIHRVDAAEVVTHTAEGFRPAAARAGLALTVDVADGRLDTAADPERLAQVVANLTENAMKFAASAITVSAHDDSRREHVVIAVADDGPGIPAEDLPRVFDRLYQSARTPARQVGSGLGLAIVAELVAAMGGTVRATSPPGGGTRVEVIARSWSSSHGESSSMSSSSAGASSTSSTTESSGQEGSSSTA